MGLVASRLQQSVHMRKLRDATAVLVLVSTGSAFGQTDARGQYEQWREQRNALRVQAQTALDSETTRGKAKMCPQANNTREWEICLAAEGATTQANYDAFAGAIRAMIALAPPSHSQPTSGPQGLPRSTNELVAQFDLLEAESKQYRKDAARAAFDQFEGGSGAPPFELEAEVRLLRLHMQEIAFLYGEELSTH